MISDSNSRWWPGEGTAETTPEDEKETRRGSTMLVCHCNGVSERKIRRVIRAGAATASEVGRACGAGSCCGGCVGIIDELITSERASHEAVTAPSSPTTDRPRL
jgi:bacterioferritin-associated ferredoxin